MRDIYIKTKTGEIRKLNKKKLLRLILVLLGIIAAVVGGIILIVHIATGSSKVAGGSEEELEPPEPIMGDIFSRGYYKKNSTEILSAKLSDEALSRLEQSTPAEAEVLHSVYEEMKKDNPDFAGYLSIEGTRIEYPIMHTPDEPEKYLHKDINGRESSAGLPFIDARCSVSPDSDNIIIYGHNMRDGSMFGELDLYEDPEYCREHPVIHFDSADEAREYEIMSVFYDRVYYTDEDEFRFYNFIDADGKEDYNRTMDRLIDKSVYDTGVRAQYGDKIITLVTCAYQEDNGRFVVIARRTP